MDKNKIKIELKWQIVGLTIFSFFAGAFYSEVSYAYGIGEDYPFLWVIFVGYIVFWVFYIKKILFGFINSQI